MTTPRVACTVDRQVAALADDWTVAATDHCFVSWSRAELHRRLGRLAEEVLDAAGSDGPRPGERTAAARRVGAQLVTGLGLTQPAVLEQLVTALGERVEVGPSRFAAIAGAVAAGFATALQERTYLEQEQISTAAFAARTLADRDRQAIDARFAAVVAASASGIMLLDVDGRAALVNPALVAIAGRPADDLLGLDIDGLLSAPADAQLRATLRALVNGQSDGARFTRPVRRPDGTVVQTEVAATPIRPGGPGPRQVVLMVEDTSRRHALEQNLRHQAGHDPLTGLANRTMLAERLKAALADPHAPLSLCFLGLDGFKAVNDTLGHDVGDQLLRVAADRLSAVADAATPMLVARTGGDEFVVLVTAPPATVAAVVTELHRSLGRPVPLGPHRITVTASIGVVDRHRHERDVTRPVDAGPVTPAELMQAADTTLYAAKSAGGDRITHYEPRRHRAVVERFAMSARLPDALARDEFVVEYQPLVDLADHRVVGVEALVRWDRPGHGRIGPDTFIPLAEETGLIVPLGRAVLERACRQAVRWRRPDVDGPGGPAAPPLLSVNLSARQLRDPGLVADVAAILADTGWPADALQLELTETAVLGSGAPLAALHELAATGVRIAIDDFGTGYSNLAYLPTLPVHAVKLAGRFVTAPHPVGRAGVDPVVAGDDGSVLALLIELSHRLGCQVIAEAVETAEHAERLRRLGCDIGQGWHFAAAVPGEQVPALLATRFPPR